MAIPAVDRTGTILTTRETRSRLSLAKNKGSVMIFPHSHALSDVLRGTRVDLLTLIYPKGPAPPFAPYRETS